MKQKTIGTPRYAEKKSENTLMQQSTSPKTKRAILLTLLILSSYIAAFASAPRGEKNFKATHPAVSYIGRVQKDTANGIVRYDWVGTYLRTAFTGSGIAVNIADEGESYHNVFVDGQKVKKIHVKGKNVQRIVLASGLKKGRHELKLQKCTEGEYGCTMIEGFDIMQGAELLPVEKKSRMIEFIGDSYTCGYGTEANRATEPFKLETENCDKAFACILARYFDADYSLVAHSGRGMVRNYGDTVQMSKATMSQRYNQIFDQHDTTAYRFDAYRPNLVVINLGTNDFSRIVAPTAEQYVGAYIKMLDRVKTQYGDVPVICVKPHSANPYLAACIDILRRRTLDRRNIHFAEFMPGIITTQHDLGASYHPNYRGQCKIAMTLVPLVSAIMNWDIKLF